MIDRYSPFFANFAKRDWADLDFSLKCKKPLIEIRGLFLKIQYDINKNHIAGKGGGNITISGFSIFTTTGC